jgi:integrase
MEQEEAKLEKSLFYLDKNNPHPKAKNNLMSEHNANLVREFIEKNKDLPNPPSTTRLILQVQRLKSITRMLDDIPLDEINIEDVKKLNRTMNERKMLSASDYRKSLKRFFRLKDKKKYFDLLDSEYFKENRYAIDKPLVDPEKFWSDEEIEQYLFQSKNSSLVQSAFAAILISTGARPKEILSIRKKDIFLKEQNLVIRINGTKTFRSKRSIVIKGSPAIANWNYIEPHLKTLSDEELLFNFGWAGARKRHQRICKLANIPKTKGLNFYTLRKQALTRIYGNPKLGYAQACAMAGHTPGAKAMKHYVGFSEEQLINEAPYEISLKKCPNPLCSFENEPH